MRELLHQRELAAAIHLPLLKPPCREECSGCLAYNKLFWQGRRQSAWCSTFRVPPCISFFITIFEEGSVEERGTRNNALQVLRVESAHKRNLNT